MKRRPKGTGTIVKLNDCYYGRIMIKGKVKVVRLSTNQRDSEALWKEWLSQNVMSLKTEETKHRLNELWPLIQNELVGQGLPDSRIDYHRSMNAKIVNWIESNYGKGIAVEDIDKGIVLCTIETLNKGCSLTKKKDYLSAFKNIFRVCGLSKSDVLDGIKFRKEPTKSREPFTNDEIKLILESAKSKGNEWFALIQIALYTGLRLKDCVHLRVEDMKDSIIELYPAKTKHKGTLVRIPLHPKLKDTLDSLNVQSGYFLPKVVDSYRKCSIGEKLASIFKVIGETSIEVEGRNRRVSVKGFHALRATFITRLAESGVSLPIMESLAGHLNPEQTMHYTHPDEETKIEAINVLPEWGNETIPKEIFVHPEMKKVIELCRTLISGKMRELADMLGVEAKQSNISSALRTAVELKQNGGNPQAMSFADANRIALEEYERLKSLGII